MNVALVFPLNTLYPGCQRTMPAHAGCLGMIKGKSLFVVAFRNNSTMKILTFKNLDTFDTCSSWIKRFVLKSDEDSEKKDEPFFLSFFLSALRVLSLPSPPNKRGYFVLRSHPVQTGIHHRFSDSKARSLHVQNASYYVCHFLWNEGGEYEEFASHFLIVQKFGVGLLVSLVAFW